MTHKYQRIHIVGVAGTLMGAFASYLKRAGYDVTGSDQNIYPPMSHILRDSGIQTFQGYSAENIRLARPDMVVIGNVVRRDNPEAEAVRASNIPFRSLPEFMEHEWLDSRHNIVVTGTHGKTTTTSMIAYLLRELGADPSFFIGGVTHDLPHSFHVSEKGKEFVIEGDEYDTAFWDKVPKFIHYKPDTAICTSIEFDHADIYTDLAAVESAFRLLLERIRPGGCFVLNDSFPSIDRVFSETKFPVIRYGFSKMSEYYITNYRVSPGGDSFLFDIMAGPGNEEAPSGSQIVTLEQSSPGEYNAANALAACIAVRKRGHSWSQISKILLGFQGIKRRQEVRGEVQGRRVIDDFAHHPTAVEQTARALREKYPDGRLCIVFEPRSATSRRKIFQQRYAESFGAADMVYIASPFDQSRIDPSQQFSSDELVKDLQKNGKKAESFLSVDALIPVLIENTIPGDTIAVFSNGGFDGLIDKLLKYPVS